MSRKPRKDAPEWIHHVYNRGVSQRVIFENDEDRRYFLYQLALQVRAGRIHIYAYCLMRNHFHLLIESRTGELSKAMQQVLNNYVRWFNKRRQRTGPLFESRFRSKRVDSHAYWMACMAYIDRNPVAANIVDTPDEYQWGSAHHYRQLKGPIWLARSKMEALVIRGFGLEKYDPTKYSLWFRGAHYEEASELVEKRLFDLLPTQNDPLDRMLGTPDYVERWFLERARLADGGNDCGPLASRCMVLRAVAEHVGKDPNWVIRLRGRPASGWPIMQAGLLSQMARAATRRIALELSVSQSAACDRLREFNHLIQTNPEFARLAARITRRCLAPLNEFVQGSQAPDE